MLILDFTWIFLKFFKLTFQDSYSNVNMIPEFKSIYNQVLPHFHICWCPFWLSYCWFYEIGMQIASFIKTHIFSRRRPIDGWKYMIEELGPNAKKGKGSVSRLPSLSDASTQPFKEEKTPLDSRLTPLKGR